MVLPDVNVLVYAFRTDAPDHAAYNSWLTDVINGDAAFGSANLVLSGFLRVVTHPRVFTPPSPVEDALSFAETIRSSPNCIPVSPGSRHWSIFARLCREGGAKGNLIPDAYLAALAIEAGTEWITTDRDFSRFPGLQWRHPLHHS
jgi:toxin-antitoxin system PIN domain toxin